MAASSYGHAARGASRDALAAEHQRQMTIEAVAVLLCILFAVALALRLLAIGSTPTADLTAAVTTAPALWPGR